MNRPLLRIETTTMLGQVVLGKYKVSRQLDEGGMSKIYLARQADPARDVVVKVLKESLRHQVKTVEHFRREIHIMSRFQHPHAVACYDWSTRDPNGPVLVMEYLRGVDLATLIQREGRLGLGPERTGRLLAQLGDVLQAAHDAGIVHRDIKPGNLMILHPNTPQETLKLMDFGLAKMTSMLYISPDEVFDWNLPAASGTPEYISPEMVRGIEMDGRGDLYSVGVVLYEMLTGRRPFLNYSVEGLMLAHAEQKPPRFAEVAPCELPHGIEAVVMSCLAKTPDQRPKSAWELVQAFEKGLGKRIIPSRTGSGVRPALKLPPTPTPTPAPQTAADRHAFRHSVEATMPEAMAMIKLKGFICDLGGEILESVPGMIRVRMAEKSSEKKTGFFRLLGGNRPTGVLNTPQATEVELHMERRDPAQANKLTITLVMRPAGGLATQEWRNRCGQIGRDLQAYLMGR